MEAPKPALEVAKPQTGDVVEAIEFRGSRRVPQDTLRALISTRKGDIFNEEVLRRDFMALWNTGRFDDIRLETENRARPASSCASSLTERRVVRSIKYEGTKSVTVSEILDRFKERKVGLSVESQYDPNKVQRAAVVLKEFLAERGRQYATVDPQIEQIPPSSLEGHLQRERRPQGQSGHHRHHRQQAFNDRWVIRSMKNLKPYRHPALAASSRTSSPRPSTQAKLEEDKERIRAGLPGQGLLHGQGARPDGEDLRDTGGHGWRLPLFKPNNPGNRGGHHASRWKKAGCTI